MQPNLKPTPPYRLVEKSDVGLVYRLLSEYARNQGQIYGIPVDPDSVADLIAKLMHRGIFIVGPRSCAAAMINPFPSNHEASVAHCVLWYFKTPREIKIFEELKRLCKEAGATHFSAASHFPDNTMLRYYARLGLRPTETLVMSKL